MNKHEDSKENRFNTHIRKLRERSEMSASAMAAALGIHRNTQLNYELNRDPRIEYLLKFSDMLGISFWQLIRLRVMYSDIDQALIDKALNTLTEFGQSIDSHQGTKEPKASYEFASQVNNIQLHTAEGGPFIGTLEQIAYVYQHQKNIRVFKQQGESMAPKICEDDLIVVDTNNKDITDGHIYYLSFEQQMMARRIQIGPNQQLIISCENSQFSPITLEHAQRDKLTIIGKMVSYFGHSH